MIHTLEQFGQRITGRRIPLDRTRRYLTDSPSPQTLSTTIKAIDDGDIAAMVELNEEMEAKDAHLQGVANLRRQALTALEWEIQPAAVGDERMASEAADFIQIELDRIEMFPEALEHLATAIGPGISVLELVWWRGRLVDVIEVPGHRLVGDQEGGPAIFVITESESVDGVKLESPKFVVFTPDSRAGYPMRVTITRAQAFLWIIKHYARADWTSFAETYGHPVRIAKFKKGVAPAEQDKVQEMLENMGPDLWAMFTDEVDIQFLEAARNSQPFSELIQWVEKKQSILYLGQTLTTEAGPVGSLALGRVHDNVRASLTLSDIANERRMVRRQIIAPMVRFRWPGVDVPMPTFTRRIIEEKNLDQERLEMEQLRFALELNLPVDDRVKYERLRMPMPTSDAAEADT